MKPLDAGFRCPHCGAKTLVIDTRRRAPNMLHRRRLCTECALRFTTGEIIVRPVYFARKARADASEDADDALTRQDANSAPVTRGKASE